MINLKESCRKCPGIDRCIRAVAHNINNMALSNKKDIIRCIDFADFESTVTEYVMNGFNQALTYAPATAMDTMYKSFEKSMLHANDQLKCVKKIKVSSTFFAYLKAVSDPFGIGPSIILDGQIAYWTGIPVEIDDEIYGQYEFVY